MFVQDSVIRLKQLTIDLSHRSMWTERSSRLNQTFTTLETCCVLAEDATFPSSGPKVIKLFSCSTQLSTKFQLLIKNKIPTNEEVSWFKSLRCCIYHANKC